MRRPTIQPQMIEAAITLFGRSGYKGVTTRAVAKEAGVMEANVYRLFRNKEGLYLEALKSVVDRSVDRLAYYWSLTDSNWLRREAYSSDGFPNIMLKAANGWYQSLSQNGARMLLWALMSNSKHRDLARVPLESFETILAKNLADEAKKRSIKIDVQTRAEALVMILFQHKIAFKGPSNKEMEVMERYFSDWMQSSFPKMTLKHMKQRSPCGRGRRRST